MSYATGTHIEMRHGMLPGRTTSPAVPETEPEKPGRYLEPGEMPGDNDPNPGPYLHRPHTPERKSPGGIIIPDPLPPAA
jgi:hypothetical protein